MIRFRSALAAALLFAIPSPAGAVLFADLASQYDSAPVYQGCPATGAGATRPEVEFCRELKTPAEYCAVFRVTPSLENDKDAAGAYKACIGFYSRAIEGQRLFCDYQKDSLALQEAISQNLNDMNGAKDLLGRTALATRCAQKVYSYYRFAAARQATILHKAWSGTQKILLGLGDIGAAHLKAEAHCQKNGVPGAAPGYLIVGASAYALGDQKQTHENIAGSLERFSTALGLQFSAAEAHTDQVSKRETNLGNIAAVKGMGAPGASDITGTEASRHGEETNPAVKAAAHSAKDVAAAAGKKVVVDAEKSWRVFFQEMFLPAAQHTAAGVVKENVGGAMVAVGVTYLKQGKVTQGDIAEQVFIGGVSVVAGILGAPAAATIGLSVGASMIAEKVKGDFAAYDRDVQAPYIKFAQGMVKRAGNVTSEEISRQYKERASKLAYCSKCNMRDEHVGCPGTQGFAHGYNQDPYAPADAQSALYYNPWVANSYNQYRARYPNGSTVPFLGPQSVSPVSEIPGPAAP